MITEPTDDMVDAAVKAYLTTRNDESIREAIRAAITAALQAAPVVEQNPVAIVRRYRDGTVAAEIHDKNMSEGTILYTHPQPKIARVVANALGVCE